MSDKAMDTHSLMFRQVSLPCESLWLMKPLPHVHSYPLNVLRHAVCPVKILQHPTVPLPLDLCATQE